MSDLVKRLRGRRMSWVGAGMDPDPDCSEAAARIEQLERELADAQRVIFEAGREAGNLMGQLAAEKALADDLYIGSKGTANQITKAWAAYRKARGL